jgi:MFS family permease
VTTHERKAWLVVAGLFLTLFLLMGSTVDCVGLFFTPILKEFGWSHSRTSLIFMVLSGGMGLSSPLAGALLNRVGARPVMSFGMLLLAAGFIIGSRANSLPPLLVAFALIGLGVGAASFTPTQIVLSNWFEQRRGLAFGLTFAGANLGAVCVPPLVSQIVSRFGWRNSFVSIAGWAILIGIPNILLLVRTGPTDSVGRGPANEAAPLAGLRIKTALSTYAFWMLVAVPDHGGTRSIRKLLPRHSVSSGLGISTRTGGAGVQREGGSVGFGQYHAGQAGRSLRLPTCPCRRAAIAGNEPDRSAGSRGAKYFLVVRDWLCTHVWPSTQREFYARPHAVG